MARCPFAKWMPLPEQGRQRATEEKRLLVYHSAAGASKTLFPFFRDSTELESHFFISYPDGLLEQYLDTDQRADANRMVNDEAISVETGDKGDPDRQPWTPPMMETGARLGRWCADVHPRIGRVRATGPDGHGIGYHTMWGAPSAWTPVAKTCPGRARILQFPALLKMIQDDEGELSMGDISEIVKRLDSIKQDTKDMAGELFHYPTLTEPVPQLPQRKTQFWNLLIAGGKVPALEKRLDAIEETQKAILAAVTGKTI